MRFKSIVSLCLSFVILFSFGVPTRAAEATNAAYFANGSFWDQMLIGLVMGAVEWPFGDAVQDIAATVSGEICPSSEDGLHRTSRTGLLGRPSGFNPDVGRYGVAVCDYCGKDFKIYSGDLKERGSGFVDGLPDGISASNNGVIAYGDGFSLLDSSNYSTADLIALYPPPFLYDELNSRLDQFLFIGRGPYDYLGLTVRVVEINSISYRRLNVKSTTSLSPYTAVDFPMRSLVTLTSMSDEMPWNNQYIFASYSEALKYHSNENASAYFLTEESYLSFYDVSSGRCFQISGLGFISSSGIVSYNYSLLPASGGNFQYLQQVAFPVSYDCSFAVPADSRTSSLMQTIHTYNTNNSYVDNSSNVNFFIVPSGDEPSADTAISPSIYDEETLVYTDPVTGTQYLTNGWTYDYLTRCYTLDMADESYKIGDTVIDTIKLTYGDELLTVDHYSGGSLIQSDEYNYVMMSGSACAIDGHTYNVETTKEPTCTAAGERTYTCSVCGNQYVEEITKTDHAYGNYEIEQEATCTAPGIASYTCTTCGGQYTDTLPALGHDWQPTAATEESYVMPDNVHCPDCYGSDFTYTRSDYEILTGKNLFNFPERSYVYENAFGSDSVRQFDSNSAYVGLSSNNFFNNSKISSFEYDSDLNSFDVSAAGGYGVGFPFALTPGKQYSLSAIATSDPLVCVSFYDSEGKLLSWSSTNYINATFTVPDDAYWTVLLFRDYNESNGVSASYSQVQLEEGSEITEYEPYTTKEIEIIPPIYTFTCSDCSTVWTKEAEYQGATVTYTCTRCHETRTEASGEEAGLFHSIGNLIADGITWATDKLTQLVENLSGINKTFNDYANSIRENTGQFPAFLGAILALMPEDFMNVIWLGVVALVALAVWKKWFS